MQRGEIVEVGSHEELLTRAGGLYAHLWDLQSDQARSAEPAYSVVRAKVGP
jgi:subfamily B ATP-binding cassette protein HlyB/CyaB